MRVRAKNLSCALEVLVGIEALANLVDGQTKDCGIETLATARHQSEQVLVGCI